MTIEPSGIITLLTDFGTRDPYVGVMRGVILARFRAATIVDLTHEIAPQDIAEAGFWLSCVYRWFPSGTVHIAVVDPGVGTERSVLVARADDHLFVAPDNGLLGPVLDQAASSEVRALDARRVNLMPLSRTFHGRDVFAPAGAEIAAGRWRLAELGANVASLPAPRSRPGRQSTGWVGSVATVDHFGNLITNLRVEPGASTKPRLRVAGQELPTLGTYNEAAIGQAFAYAGSFGTWEIAVRNGSASRDLGIGRGAKVELVEAEPDASTADEVLPYTDDV